MVLDANPKGLGEVCLTGLEVLGPSMVGPPKLPDSPAKLTKGLSSLDSPSWRRPADLKLLAEILMLPPWWNPVGRRQHICFGESQA